MNEGMRIKEGGTQPLRGERKANTKHNENRGERGDSSLSPLSPLPTFI